MIATLLAAAALLSEAGPSAAPAARPTKGDEIVCRTEAEFGSRVARRICRSKAQMQERKTQDREMTERWQTNTMSIPNTPDAIWTPVTRSSLMAPPAAPH